ncbi:Ca-transporting ATPase [Armillaria mellea]|nr:Ca-transporting ATPase [Armillaria mellea]
MGYERKRSGPFLSQPGSSSSSSFSRRGRSPQRSPSPPASTYFPLLASDPENARLQPVPDAEAHFSYSTTLRRHHLEGSVTTPSELASAVNAEASSLWSRVLAWITGQPPDDHLESGRGTPRPEPPKHTLSSQYAHCSVEDTISHYRTSLTDGLLKADIPNLLGTHGYNEFSVATPEPILLKFVKTIYESPLILLLCASATISAVIGNIDDAVSITIAVLIRSEKSLEALNKLVPHHCHVIRERETLHVLANELVPGDIVTFSTGDRIPADLRMVSCVDVEIDESSLTGETVARQKSTEACVGPTPAALADRTCIAYMGTLVRNGRGTGVVIATGTDTEFGTIFTMMQDVEEKRSPLQLSMDELAQKLSMISFGVIGLICLIGVLQKRSWLEMFTIGVSLAVAAIPEGLPIVTTVTLALGVQRMAHRKAIVKKLHSVEALGSVSVICSDKTGTLTKNEQTVIEAYSVDEVIQLDNEASPTLPSAVRMAIDIGALSGTDDGSFVGQSTDVALLNVLYQVGLPDRRTTFQRLSEKPFNSEHKYMAVSGIHQDASSSGRELCYLKGSIDVVLDRCKFYYVNDESTPALDQKARNVILSKAKATASRGLRVMAMAYGYGSVHLTTTAAVNGNAMLPSAPPTRTSSPAPGSFNMVFAGFQAMLDPPRKGVSDSIALLQAGGVQVVMITGDAEETALSIARKLGLKISSDGSGCLTGAAIDRMSQEMLMERVGHVSVFARTTPRHKMAIVRAFQARGKIVAMTGDGVNDAPALKMADIGVSMGKSGTDVAKEAADVILVDDNFSTILPAVEEGKSIFHNIQNFLSFQLSTAAAALTLITLSTMLGLSNPLNAMQILFINILMDGPPSQSLGVDPVDPAVMRRPPRKKDASIITKRVLYRVLFSASIIVFGTLFVYMFALEDDKMSRREQTMTFTAFVFLDLVSAIQNRGLGCGLTHNKMLLTTVSVSAITQIALVYVPVMQSVFQTEGLRMDDLGVILGLAGTSMCLHECRRRWERKGIEENERWGRVSEMV